MVNKTKSVKEMLHEECDVDCKKPWRLHPCAFKKHTKEYVDGTFDYHCQNCDKKFITKEQLSTHKYVKHTEKLHLEKKIQCPHCPKITSNQKTLTSHIRNRHTKPEKVLDSPPAKRKLRNTGSKENLVENSNSN